MRTSLTEKSYPKFFFSFPAHSTKSEFFYLREKGKDFWSLRSIERVLSFLVSERLFTYYLFNLNLNLKAVGRIRFQHFRFKSIYDIKKPKSFLNAKE